MYLKVGYELLYDCPLPTPMILMLNIHSTRANDIVVPDCLITNPCIPVTSCYDGFGNWCSRIVAPKGRLWLSTNAVVKDTGEADRVAFVDQQHAVQELPEECLVFLLGRAHGATE